MHLTDVVLRNFLHAADDAERERLLNDLILVHAAPLVQQMLRIRLGFYVSQTGTNAHQPDAEDVYQEIITKLIQRLRELQVQPDQSEIRNFQHYVKRVAANACYDYLRGKAPARARLKDRLRDLLDRHEDFVIRKSTDGNLLCGFAVWEQREQETSVASSFRLRSATLTEFDFAGFSGERLESRPLTEIIAEVFNWLGRPIELDQLVNLLSAQLVSQGLPDESFEDAVDLNANVTEPLNQSHRLEGRKKLEQFWQELCQLPKEQRMVLCLSFTSHKGEDLLTLMLDENIISLPQLAAALEISLSELMKLWPQLPMDNETIAAYLGATREQVNKMRFRALQQLRKRMADWLKK